MKAAAFAGAAAGTALDNAACHEHGHKSTEDVHNCWGMRSPHGRILVRGAANDDDQQADAAAEAVNEERNRLHTNGTKKTKAGKDDEQRIDGIGGPEAATNGGQKKARDVSKELKQHHEESELAVVMVRAIVYPRPVLGQDKFAKRDVLLVLHANTLFFIA